MNFWERVDNLLEQKGINKKTLAAEAGIDASTISKGLKSGSTPSADTAIKIAHLLSTTVEYLVEGADSRLTAAQSQEIDSLFKYSQVINHLDNLPEKVRKPIITMISEMGH